MWYYMLMSYNMPKEVEILSEVHRMSDLQKEILGELCQSMNNDYEKLENKLDKDRVTLLNSVHTLIEKGLVHAIKEDPTKVKSRQIFKPSTKGICIALGHLDNVKYRDVRLY